MLVGVVGDETAPRGEACGLLLVPLSEAGPCAFGDTGPVLLLGALKCSEPEGMYTEVVRDLAGGVVFFVSIAKGSQYYHQLSSMNSARTVAINVISTLRQAHFRNFRRV